jgi:hypothetical protein
MDICNLDFGGICCCNCRYHIRDFHHCTTTGQVDGKCVCGAPRGWICMPPESGVAYSGWGEHGLCEMHSKREL